MKQEEMVMHELLYLYDYSIRAIDKTRDDYGCGYADAIGQCILDIGKILGDGYPAPYKYEAFKRAMQFESVEQYKRNYRKRVVR